MNRRGADYLDMVMDLTRNTKVVNYLGLPALSVPCGLTGNGLPTSFQLVGRPLSEASLLAAAHRYEQATAWHLAAPSLVTNNPVVCTENLIRVDDVMESPKLAE
jgi:aspartyl-tRNA(Asn)/glutamyl-tRNA(Gln) amidotransferase subunit A